MTVCGLIQAHYLGWEGAKDRSLAKLGGRYVIEHVIHDLRSIVDQIVLAVPDCRENKVFLKLAMKHGVHCHFGPQEDVLERCQQAIEAVDAGTVVHVMGQHCFLDSGLLEAMLQYRRRRKAPYVSMPDDFSPDFSGKIYTAELLSDVSRRISIEPEKDQTLHRARFCSFVECNPEHFGAVIYPRVPKYSENLQKLVRRSAAKIFKVNHIQVDETKASRISNPISESYEIAAAEISPTDHVLDIACGNGHGSRILAKKARYVTAVDKDRKLILRNRRINHFANIEYVNASAFALPHRAGEFSHATAMEFIEHLEPSDVELFLAETKRVLAPGGKFFCSTPQNGNGIIPVCPHHQREYSRHEFKAMLSKHFQSVKILSSKSGGKLSEANQTGQKMLAICQ